MVKLKDKNKKYSISEASEIIGFSKHVLRFYEKEFNIIIPRNKSNHRYYTYTEIEKYLYIKALKERGLSNQQIKVIINSPEEIIDNKEIAVTKNEQLVISNELIPDNQNNPDNYSKELQNIKEIIGNEININILSLKENITNDIEELFNKYLNDDKNITNTEKDALISENARLRMKLKEKTYETAMLKEKLKRLENKKSFISKLFGTS